MFILYAFRDAYEALVWMAENTVWFGPIFWALIGMFVLLTADMFISALVKAFKNYRIKIEKKEET